MWSQSKHLKVLPSLLPCAAALLITTLTSARAAESEPAAPAQSVSAPKPALAIPDKPLIVAHYMSWFQTPEFSGSWGFWQVNRKTIPQQYWHWPEKKKAGDSADVASVYCPIIGPYDSADPDTCEYHILQAKLAGIDGFVADWYGPDPSTEHPYDNIGFMAMKRAAEKLNFKVMICWEDRSAFPPISPKVTTRQQAVERGKEILRYLQQEWFSSPAYLKMGDRPVLDDYAYGDPGKTLGEPCFSSEEWNQVLNSINPRPVFLHDWHRHKKANEFKGFESAIAWGDTYHGNADRADDFWAGAEAAVKSGNNAFLCGTVLPGFDNRGCGGWGTDGAIGITDRRDGQKYRATWDDVMRHNIKFIQITTWNDLNEGGCIEPVREVTLHQENPAPGYGYRELETTAEYAGKLKGFTPDKGALRVPAKIYFARKAVKAMAAKKAPLPAGTSILSLNRAIDKAREELLAGNTAAAERLLADFKTAPH